jgi:uncharacterized protein (TIGR03083 family)
MDAAEIYATSRAQLLDLAGGLDADAAAEPVSATPPWTVKDAYAHLTGVCADVLAGNMEGAGSSAWTDAQIDARRDADLAAVCDEWRGRSAEIDAWLEAAGGRASFMAFDVWTHEQDIRGATESQGVRDDRLPWLVATTLDMFSGRFAKEGVPALRVVSGGVDRVIGEGEPAATLKVEPYELMRMIFGRRSEEQYRGADWEGDPTPYLESFRVFELHPKDLAD